MIFQRSPWNAWKRPKSGQHLNLLQIRKINKSGNFGLIQKKAQKKKMLFGVKFSHFPHYKLENKILQEKEISRLKNKIIKYTLFLVPLKKKILHRETGMALPTKKDSWVLEDYFFWLTQPNFWFLRPNATFLEPSILLTQPKFCLLQPKKVVFQNSTIFFSWERHAGFSVWSWQNCF